MYLILSLKHTSKQDESITLWRENNQGYCIYLEDAGQYEKPIDDYHNSENNLPIDQDTFFKLQKVSTNNNLGESVTFILNSKTNREILGLKFVKRNLCRTTP